VADMTGELRPVVVQDADDGAVLMLAWANDEALAATRHTGQAHFWSRSRDALWRKGATSGNVMHVDEVVVDCDADALLYRVHPTGPACHTGRRTCFDADSASPAAGRLSLEALERIIDERSAAATSRDSYTARLLSGGPAAAAAKVVEEAGEVSRAAVAETDERLTDEAADLLYHLLVTLRAREVRLSAVLERLADRHAARGASSSV
jgi:phosphoribosyl-AMP cyclohydrolase / phosphoribosyl-ATP pyrophosphohydrolase